MENVTKTEAVRALRTVEGLIGEILETREKYETWLKTEERRFRERMIPGDMLYPAGIYHVENGYLDENGNPKTDPVEANTVKMYIGVDINYYDFYPAFFSDPRNKFTERTPETRLFRRFHDTRKTYNKELQKLLTYVIETGDQRMAAEALPLINDTPDESAAGDAFWYAADDKTHELANDFHRAVKIYITPAQTPDPGHPTAPDPTPTPIPPETTDALALFRSIANIREKTKTPEVLEAVFNFLKEQGCIDGAARLSDWLHANGWEQEGEGGDPYQFQPIRWNADKGRLSWVVAILYPVVFRADDYTKNRVAPRANKWAKACFVSLDTKTGIHRPVTSMGSAKRDFNGVEDTNERFCKALINIVRPRAK